MIYEKVNRTQVGYLVFLLFTTTNKLGATVNKVKQINIIKNVANLN